MNKAFGIGLLVWLILLYYRDIGKYEPSISPLRGLYYYYHCCTVYYSTASTAANNPVTRLDRALLSSVVGATKKAPVEQVEPAPLLVEVRRESS